jgi:hypothetical protein
MERKVEWPRRTSGLSSCQVDFFKLKIKFFVHVADWQIANADCDYLRRKLIFILFIYCQN